MVKIELIYVNKARKTVHFSLELNDGATVADALDASAIYSSHPETKAMMVGIYAKQVALDTLLKDGDRVEIYRPLLLDPKDNRRHRVHAKK
ncbi:MAG: RnfH family protein [Legionella sp.]|uniref:RnfH family protein n=1 Tax=Legionella sp. TaxID=459 RepID=UPI0039E53261